MTELLNTNFLNDANCTNAVPQTGGFSKAVYFLLKKPVFMGVLVAFFVIAGFWVRYDQGAGSDALLYYLRYPPENATVPI